MEKPTNEDVVEVFDTLGGTVVRPMALKSALEKKYRLHDDTAYKAINQAIADKIIGKTPEGGLFLLSKT